ncbi:MAG: PIN domain-containing protein [Pseudobdellovibrionaceae bacterium]|nr:PIN domain-containing protein [Pseudobdellovibrionaceae bacterium]
MSRSIVIDTSVLSHFFRKSGPSKHLQDWYQSVLAESLLISTVTRYEMIAGLAMLPNRKILEDFEAFIDDSGIVEVPVSPLIANIAGLARADLRKAGKTHHVQDLLIGATAKAIKEPHVCIATANIKDFDVWGIEIVNPI